eukprot:10498941-Alexandrium_andersonii.AAC.1
MRARRLAASPNSPVQPTTLPIGDSAVLILSLRGEVPFNLGADGATSSPGHRLETASGSAREGRCGWMPDDASK